MMLNSIWKNNKMKFIAKTAFLLMAPIGLITSSAVAQGTGNVAASGWFKTCNKQGNSDICNVQYRVVTKQGNQLVTSLNLIEVKGETNRKIFRIIVPTGRSLPKGIQVQVDGKRSVVIPYSYCRPQLCGAEVILNDELVNVFKAGNGLVVTSINFQEKQNPVPVTLKGFTAAFNGPAVKLEDPASREELLKKQLEDSIKSQQGAAN